MLLFFCEPPNWVIWFSSIASVFAILFLFLYFVYPRLKFENECDFNNKNIRIKCINKNRLGLSIKDIKCDIVASEKDNFDITDTLELYKDWTAGIRYKKNYTFKVKKLPENFDEKKYLKIRILAPNLLGVKKLYEIVIDIEQNQMYENHPICLKLFKKNKPKKS